MWMVEGLVQSGAGISRLLFIVGKKLDPAIVCCSGLSVISGISSQTQWFGV